MTGDTISKNVISENGIHTEHLTVGYDRIPLIRDINLSVGRGEILTLIGPNGSGKSTILKTITRQLREVEGTVFLGKDSMQKLKDSEVSKRLSMVMTERIKTELQTGREIVASGRYPYTGRFGVLSERDWAKVDEAIALVHAEKVQAQDFMKISDGQRQRLMLARAICQDTDILILDEPTSYLDMGFKMDILANIRMLAREKKMAIIMSLHELDLAAKVSDIIACVKGAEIDRVGTPEEIFSGDYVQKLYGVPEKSFDPVTGEVFPGMGQAQRSPEVFVIGGAGDGIPVYNRLCRQNIPFAAGILQENDVEYPTARALAAEVVSQKAFYLIEEAQITEAKKWIDQCERCICTLKPDMFGPLNEVNRQLLEYAKETGKNI